MLSEQPVSEPRQWPTVSAPVSQPPVNSVAAPMRPEPVRLPVQDTPSVSSMPTSVNGQGVSAKPLNDDGIGAETEVSVRLR